MELGSTPVPISNLASDSGKLFSEYGCRQLKVRIDRLDIAKLQSGGNQGWFKLGDKFVPSVRTPRSRRPKEYLDFEMSPVTSRLKNKENGMVLLHRATYNKNPGKCVLPRSHSVTSYSNKKLSSKEKSITKNHTAIPIKTKNDIGNNNEVIGNNDQVTVSDSHEKSNDTVSNLLDASTVSNEKNVVEENATKDEVEKVCNNSIITASLKEETSIVENADKTGNKCPQIQGLEVVAKRRKSLPDRLRKAVTTESIESGLDNKCKKPLRAKSVSLSGDIKVDDTALMCVLEDRKKTNFQSIKNTISNEESGLDNPEKMCEVLVTEKKPVKNVVSKKRKLISDENPQKKNDTESIASAKTKFHLKLQKKAKLTIDKQNVRRNKLQKVNDTKGKDSNSKQCLRSDTMLKKNIQRRKLRNNKDITSKQKKNIRTRTPQVDQRDVFVNKVQLNKTVKALHSDKLQKQEGKSNIKKYKNEQNLKRVLRRRIENVQEGKLVKKNAENLGKFDQKKRKIAPAKSEIPEIKKIRRVETNKMGVKIKLKKAQKIKNWPRLKIENLFKNAAENGQEKNILNFNTESSIKNTKVVKTKESILMRKEITTMKKKKEIEQKKGKKLRVNAKSPLKIGKKSCKNSAEAQAIENQLNNFDDVEAALAKIVNGTCEHYYKNLDELYMKIDPGRFPSNLWKTETKLLKIVNDELEKSPKQEKKKSIENCAISDDNILKTSSLSEVVVKRCVDRDSISHDRLVVVNNNMNFQIKIENDTVNLLGAPSVISDIEDLYVLLQIVDETTLSSFNIDK